MACVAISQPWHAARALDASQRRMLPGATICCDRKQRTPRGTRDPYGRQQEAAKRNGLRGDSRHCGRSRRRPHRGGAGSPGKTTCGGVWRDACPDPPIAIRPRSAAAGHRRSSGPQGEELGGGRRERASSERGQGGEAAWEGAPHSSDSIQTRDGKTIRSSLLRPRGRTRKTKTGIAAKKHQPRVPQCPRAVGSSAERRRNSRACCMLEFRMQAVRRAQMELRRRAKARRGAQQGLSTACWPCCATWPRPPED